MVGIGFLEVENHILHIFLMKIDPMTGRMSGPGDRARLKIQKNLKMSGAIHRSVRGLVQIRMWIIFEAQELY